jgi:hypothetical protein
MSGLLTKIQNLEFTRIISPSGAEPDYGFSAPVAEITLWGKDDKVLGRLLIGKMVEGEEKLHYARGADAGMVYTIKEEFLKELPTEVSALQG